MKDLSSLYGYLEEKATEYKYLHDISQLFQSVRDEMHRQQKTEEETKAQWEIDVFNFAMVDDSAKPMFTMTNKEGKEIIYPTYANFNDHTYDYVANRLESTKNPVLRARYAHVLWLSPKKQLKYAQIAVDAYFDLIGIYEKKDLLEPQNHYGLDIINAIGNAVVIALKIRDTDRLKRLKAEIKRLIFNFNSKSSCKFILRVRLIELMLDKKTIFIEADFDGVSKLLSDFSKELQDGHQRVTALNLGDKVDKKQGVSSQNWKLLTAQTYESMMQAHLKSNLVAITFCTEAMKLYKELGEKGKVAELEKIYAQLRETAELKEIKIELNLEEHVKKCKEIASKIVSHSSEEILGFLAVSKDLFPKSAEIKKLTEEILKKTALLGVIPTQAIDERGHTVQNFVTKEEIFFFNTLSQYNLYLENHYLPLIQEIIIEGITEKKLSSSILIDYLSKKSWIGKTLDKTVQNERVNYSWLNLVAPSILEYFNKIDYCLSTNNYPNLVLCIDSLTLKLEGLLRDLCSRSGVTTFYQDTDKGGHTIYLERDLNALLHDEKIGQLFDEDDLLFFRFILVEKAGYNLRHRIAHSLMNYWDYQIKDAHFLLLILLRLSRFDLKPTEQNTENVTK